MATNAMLASRRGRCPPGGRSLRLVASSLGLSEGVGIHLVQDLELGDLPGLKWLAVALDLDLGGLLDPAEVLVVLVGRLRGVLLALEADDLGDLLDGQAAFLVEGEREVLAVGPGYLQDHGRRVADLLLPA